MALIIAEQGQLPCGFNVLGGYRHAHGIAQIDDDLNYAAVTRTFA